MIIQDGQNYYKNGSWHKYDFTINSEVSGMYNRKIENDVVIRFNTTSAQSYRIEMDTNYVEWLPQNIQSVTASVNERNIAFNNLWSRVNVELKPIPLGLKENILLQDNSAPTTFQFKLKTNLKVSSDSIALIFSDSKDTKIFKVPSLFAVDSKKNFLDVHFSISGADDSTYVTLSVKTDSAVFPITIDPSTILYDTSSATKDNHARAGYPDTNWGAWTSIRVGGGGPGVCFSLLQFDVSSIPNDAVIDTAQLRLYCSEYYGSPGYVHVRGFKKEWGEGDGTNTGADTGASSWNSARRYIQNWDSPGAIAT
ncbi:MAG: DNRLRE domain-containing protein, partial [Patescibacteria group bacterium]|nr:DNRLRE domain-containing protein [Patescibacteria group bacterium]